MVLCYSSPNWLRHTPLKISSSNISLHTCMLSCFRRVQLCDPVDCSPQDSSVHGIFHTRILEWVAMPSSRGSSWPRDWTCFSYVLCIADRLPWDSPISWKFSVSAPYTDVHYRNVILCFRCLLLHFSMSFLKIGITLSHLYDPRT